MTDTDPAAFASPEFAARRIDWSVARLPAATIGPDVTRGVVVIFGSILFAFAGMGLGAWMQLPFGN